MACMALKLMTVVLTVWTALSSRPEKCRETRVQVKTEVSFIKCS